MTVSVEEAFDAFIKAYPLPYEEGKDPRDGIRALSTLDPVESPDRLPVGKPEGWRAAIQRVRNQLGQAGGTGTAGAQNSITEREVGGWVLDAVEDELAALTIVASPGQPVESPAPGVREALRSIIGMAVTARSGQLHGTWADGLTEIAAFASAALSAPAAEPEQPGTTKGR